MPLSSFRILLVSALLFAGVGNLLAQDEKVKNGTWLTLPAISFSPETGFGFGGASLRLFKLNPEDTVARSSQIRVLALYTTEKQFIFNTRYQLFTFGENLFLTGRVEFLKFPEFYYGVGSGTSESNEELVEYNFIGLEKRLLKQLIPGFFSGLEFRYYNRFNYSLVESGLLERSMVAGFNGSEVVGLGPLFVIDKRDNIANPYKGYYLLVSSFFHGKLLGGEFQYNNYRVDFRKYFKLSENLNHILAFQVFGNFVEGRAPFHNLSLLGGSSLMRGYYRGRFRDNHMVASQVEYRMPVWWRFGLVGFAGVGNVANQLGDMKITRMKPSYGGGLRILIDETERLNMRLDFGFGDDTAGFYLNVTEAF